MQDVLKIIQSDPMFFILSVIAIGGSIGVILQKSIVRAGFSLVICFAAVSGIYFALRAPFVAASQILIYAVGITLIVIFAIMLTSLKHEMPKIEGESFKNALSAIISVSIFFVLSFALTGNKWLVFETPIACPKNTEVIGLRLLSTYALPFELISVLLLVALIGGVVIAKKDKKNV